MIRTRIEIQVELHCPHHPNYRGDRSPKGCVPCQAVARTVSKLAAIARQAHVAVDALLHEAVAAGCVTPEGVGALASGSNA